ncbi:MAG: hypothetical protein M1434_11775 [Chloroflexi bacterium]|nr:hypothetical protein [Chloroflexota bacterium]MCL5275402.1 hypothetical protein [Chloroflexota bacterium]
MNTLSTDELKSLVEKRSGPFVSISLPTLHAGVETRQNPIRFRKLLRNAEEQLIAAGSRPVDTQLLLSPARKLLEDPLFWQHQDEGLAVFIAPGFFRHYEMPAKPEELVVVGDRFHIKPVLHMLSGERRFHILAISQNRVRLLDAQPGGAREVELKGVPGSLDEAMKYDLSEKQLQFRTVTNTRPGKGDAVFYGLGAPSDLTKERILRYLHQIDDGLCKQIKDQRAPLVFAGVEYLFPMYKEVNTYARLMEQAISGNPDDMGAVEFHKRAWTIVQPFFEKAKLEAADFYRQLAGTPRASNQISRVAPAAHQGRVEVLFVQTGAMAWGSYAPEIGAMHEYETPQPGSEDMLDFAAVHTLLNGGTVYAVDSQHMPNGSSVAAIFRY